MRYLILLLLFLPIVGATLSPIEFFPIPVEDDIDLYGSSFLNTSANTALVTFRWYENGGLIKSTTQNLSNNSYVTNGLFSEEYTEGNTISMNISTPQESVFGTVVQCNDGLDNDGDGLTDAGFDPDCGSFEDTSEASGESCASGSSGSGSFTPAQEQTSQIITSSSGSNASFLGTLQDLISSEIPCNNLDDNHNGLIDETCTTKNLTITTDAGSKKFVLYVPPNSVRADRAVLLTNNGLDIVAAKVSCEGTGCNLIQFDTPQRMVLPSSDLPERVPFTIAVPITVPQGTKYLLSIVGTDTLSGQRDNILLELHIDSRLSILKVFDKYLANPYCRNVSSNRPLCVNGYTFLSIGVIAAFLIWLGVYMVRRKK